MLKKIREGFARAGGRLSHDVDNLPVAFRACGAERKKPGVFRLRFEESETSVKFSRREVSAIHGK